MKKLFLFSTLIASIFVLKNSFSLSYVCDEREGLKTKTPILITVDSSSWEYVDVHRQNSDQHSYLPCARKFSNVVCEISSGDPEKGGGCSNPYMQERFTLSKHGTASYFYVNNGFIYQRYDYSCQQL